ncbi:hypothetical protein Hanom_Chr14g01264461 [Helianthus anomalus]
MIHAMGHRKGGFDVLVNYQMCMIVASPLNLPYSFTRLMFEQMKINITKEKAAEGEVVSSDKGKGKIDDKEPDKEKETYEKEDDEDLDIDGPNHGDNDDKGDDDEDNNQGGTGLVKGDTEHDEENSGIFTDVTPLMVVPEILHIMIYLEHGVEEGEFFYNYSKEEIEKMMGIDENLFEFDFEEELNNINISKLDDYVFRYVEDADNYDNVVVEDDYVDKTAKYYGEGTNEFPSFQELFNKETNDLLKRKNEETVKDGKSPRLSKEEIM